MTTLEQYVHLLLAFAAWMEAGGPEGTVLLRELVAVTKRLAHEVQP
jgi:hypothetical protein